LRKTAILVVVLVAVAFVGSAFAVGPGKNIEFAGGATGKVTFSGDVHKVNKCTECHTAIFQMKKGTAKITSADHVPGKFCGSCHDGTKGFDQKGNCQKCHVK
jgi:c(7)-type cytochrome triheme protein